MDCGILSDYKCENLDELHKMEAKFVDRDEKTKFVSICE